MEHGTVLGLLPRNCSTYFSTVSTILAVLAELTGHVVPCQLRICAAKTSNLNTIDNYAWKKYIRFLK